MRNISITEKIILYFILLGTGAIMIIGYYSYSKAREALMSRTFDQLTSVKKVRKNQIESFFNDRVRDVDLISKTKDVYSMLNIVSLSKKETNKKKLAERFYKEYNQYLNKYLSVSNYYRNFIIGDTTGLIFNISTTENDSIIYISKLEQTDPIIKRLWHNVLHTRKITLQDYQNNINSLYIGGPITDKQHKTEGIVLLQISPDAINRIMLEHSPENGLGTSGESYLVGKDFLMRSTSRFQKNSLLKTLVKTEGALNAFTYNDGYSVIHDYRDIPVLSSYGKLNITGLDWVILAEIDLSEAMVPIYSIRNNIILFTLVITVALFIFAYFLSKRITQPIIRLKEATNLIAKGNFEVELKEESSDEIGVLTQSFNYMSKRLKQQTEELKEREEERLSAALDGQEIERQRLSRELHDGLGQSLIAVKLMLESTVGADNTKTQTTITGVRNLFDKTINEVRRISNNLMPAVLDQFGITNAIRSLCDEVSELSKIKVSFEATNISEHLNDRIKTYIYRITQEALNNIIKHSKATKAHVALKLEANFITLNITDNGTGFKADSYLPNPQTLLPLNKKSRHGIYNIYERVHLLQGNVNFTSEPGKGTHIFIKLPISSEFGVHSSGFRVRSSEFNV